MPISYNVKTGGKKYFEGLTATRTYSSFSAAFMIIGCAVFASDFNDDYVYSKYGHLNWGFGFNIVAAIFTAAAGAGLILHALFATTTTNSPK